MPQINRPDTSTWSYLSRKLEAFKERRSLMDIVSGGQYKTSRDLPDFKELIDLAADRQAVWMSEEIYPGSGVTQGNLYDMVIGAASVAPVGRAIKTASTGKKLFSGWRDNLLEYMAGASKKERRLTDTIIRKASDIVNVDDVEGTRSVLQKINSEWGLSQNLIPKIQGAAGGAMRQSRKKRGAQAAKQTKGEKWRKQEERKAEIAAKKRKQTGDEPYHRGTLKLE